MSVLDFVLDDRSFDDLVELARSRLPAGAPGWTDYNLHDPGITLIELMAWLAEGQIYSLGRMRRDEREAYARLAGVSMPGPCSARGLIWPDAMDPSNTINAQVRPLAIGATPGVNPIHPLDAQLPPLRVAWPTLIVPGRVAAVTSLLASGERLDRTAGNARGQAPYLPFGPDAGPQDRLRIDYVCTAPSGLADRPDTDRDALLSLGVRVDGAAAGDTPDSMDSASKAPMPNLSGLEATLLQANAELPLQVVHDTTQGLTRSGAIAFRLPRALPAAQTFTLELRARRGFACPPSVCQIALNVLAVEQAEDIDHELHLATGRVDQLVQLDALDQPTPPLLRYDGGAEPPLVELDQGAGIETWRAVAHFDKAGPDDPVYVLDIPGGQLQFGNGINGRVPIAGAKIYVTYSVCLGRTGNQPRPRAWFAAGIGPVGRDLVPLAGGNDARSLTQARTAARRALRERHPLVTADDIVSAALALPGMRVARAQVLPQTGNSVPGEVTLLALRTRAASGTGPDEPQRWLDALRAWLQPHLLLGERLVVRAPDYVDFALQATLEAMPMRNPEAVRSAALAELARRLDPVGSQPTLRRREPGDALSSADIGAWLRKLDGVAAVRALALHDATGKVVDALPVPPYGLPRLDVGNIQIDVQRATHRGQT